MPALLLPEAEAECLNLDTTLEQTLAVIRPYPDGLMETYEVSTLISSPASNSPDIFKPINNQ